MTVTMVLVASLLLQCIAVVLALWLIRITGRWPAWSFIAAAILLMAVRGGMSMHRWISRDPSHLLDVAFEVECLVGSALVVAGVASIIPLFRSIECSRGELRESTEFSSSLLSNAPNPILVINPDSSIRYVNPALERLTGFSSGEIVGRKPPYPWWPEDAAQRIRGVFKTALRTGVQKLEESFQKKNGGRFWVEITSTAVSHDGAFRYYVSNWVDVTERKRAEESLKSERDKLQSLMDGLATTGIGVDVVGADYRIVSQNEILRQRFGDTAGKLCYETYMKRSEPCDFCRLAEAIRDRKRQKVEVVASDGRDYEVFSGPFGNPDGTVDKVAEVVVDITERKQAEKELARYRDHLEELVEQRTRELADSREQVRQAERLASIGTLAAGVAHEINNPVGGILIAAQGALGEIDGPQDQRYIARCLNEIVEDAKRCSRIVKSILGFAREEPTEKWASDINAVVMRSIDLTRELVDNRGAMVTLELGEGVSAVPLNPIEFEQVLVNLITNAVEAAGEGVRVTVRTERRDATARVTVADDGPGMPPERLKHVFDPFYTTRQRAGGTGLGLSVVHGIIQAHGGNIDVKSQPGLGTVFTIDLPC
ncbi:MAG: PAS domain S-box protein [Phycisphaerales bacterium]|nr:MAG: PAS domain S-box protein [Phycisphaerales bacterium]